MVVVVLHLFLIFQVVWVQEHGQHTTRTLKQQWEEVDDNQNDTVTVLGEEQEEQWDLELVAFYYRG